MKAIIYLLVFYWVSCIHGEEAYGGSQFFERNRSRRLRPMNAKDRAYFSQCKGQRKYTDKAYGEIPLRWPGTYKSTAPRQGYTDDACLAHAATSEDLWQARSSKQPCNATSSHALNNTSPHKLFVCIGAHVDEEPSFMLLMKAVCSVRKFHGDSTVIFIFDNGSPHEYYQRMAVMAEYEKGIILQRVEESHWEWGALNASLHWIGHMDGWQHFTHFAYLQHSMSLLQPLPLTNLGCPVVSYRTFGPGWLSVGFGMAVTVGEWMTLIDPTISKTICKVWEMVYFTYSVGFVSHMWAVRKMHQLGVFSKIKIDSKGLDMLSERMMGAVSYWLLGSNPEVCNLDGDYLTLKPDYVDKVSHESIDNLHYEGVNQTYINHLCDSSAWPALVKIKEAFQNKK